MADPNFRKLIISYAYAPVQNARAFRWTALAEFWANQDQHVDVVCDWKPGLPRYEVKNGVRIHRVGSSIINKFRDDLRVLDGTSLKPTSASRGLKAWIGAYLRDRIWKNVYWPDSTCLWYFSALRKAMSLSETEDYSILISVSPSFTAHLVGKSLKKNRPSLSWIVDIGDPFCFYTEEPPNNHRLYTALNYRAEEGVFDTADAISVTNDAARNKYGAVFPNSAQKIAVIPPLISFEKKIFQERFFPDDGKTRLVFVGTLYNTIRSPDFLLELFRSWLDSPLGDFIELHFLGNVNDCSASFSLYAGLLGKKIFLHGVVEREKVIQAMQEATILVNIGNATNYQLPSKVVEYVAMNKPILNLCRHDNDSSTLFFSKYSQSLSVKETGDPAQLGRLKEIYDFVSGVRRTMMAGAKPLDAFKIEAVAAAYDRLAPDMMRKGEPSRLAQK